jgi:integrase/recombinase XerD
VDVDTGDGRGVLRRPARGASPEQSTARGYQNALRLFCSYVSNPDYGWDRVCEQRFGNHPAQIFFDWNTAEHVQDNESAPTKRAFTKGELQDLFDHADDRVSSIAASGRKGWLPAYRDAVMFKLAYSYGLFSGAPAACVSAIL